MRTSQGNRRISRSKGGNCSRVHTSNITMGQVGRDRSGRAGHQESYSRDASNHLLGTTIRRRPTRVVTRRGRSSSTSRASNNRYYIFHGRYANQFSSKRGWHHEGHSVRRGFVGSLPLVIVGVARFSAGVPWYRGSGG